jgi:16S rRNA (uracil1498-N3)-methyltransferase
MPSTAADRRRAARQHEAGAVAEGDSRPPVFLAGPGGLAADTVFLDGPEGRHAATVRRLAPGERADLTDGAGQVAECVVTATRAGTLELAVRARRREPRPEPLLAVAQALPKGDRGQLAVELMTEAGVDLIVPWAAQRCVTRWHGDRGERALERWRATAVQAAKQARRAWLPEVAALESTAGLAQRVRAAGLALLLDPGAAATVDGVCPPSSGEILVIVGPEGGVDPAETAVLTEAGAVPARLGPTVLRTSTAGVVAAAIVSTRSGRWS